MIKINDILYGVTSKLANVFTEDIFVDETVQGFDKSCFFVQILPSVSTAATRTTNKKVVLISVKYLLDANDSKLKLNDVLDKLEELFSRHIKVKDSFLNISNVEPSILKDEVGEMLDFLITINFFDDIKQDLEAYEDMTNINLEMKG